jgi:hypothetical protein
LTIVWNSGIADLEQLYNLLELDKEFTRTWVDFLVKFGFLQLDKTAGQVILSSSMKELLEEEQGQVEEFEL